MSVSDSFRTYVLDQLGRAADRVRIKNMFGGAGVYAGEHFFAIVDDDVLYLKVDDTNRPDFVSHGMQPFRPFGEGGEVMQYYQLPGELLDDPDALRPWVDKAILVARRKKARPPRSGATTTSKKPHARTRPEPKATVQRKTKPKPKRR